MVHLVLAVSVSVAARMGRPANTSVGVVSAPRGGVACSVRRRVLKGSLAWTVRAFVTVSAGPSVTR